MPPLARKSLRIAALTLGALILSALALAQTPNHSTPPCKPLIFTNEPHHKPIPCRTSSHRPDTSLSLGLFPQLTLTRTRESFNSILGQSSAPSTGTLGTFRQTFNPWLGYSVNLGYSRVAEQYLNAGSADAYSSLQGYKADTNVYETSVTYIAHTHAGQRISLFGELGPGLLTFLPVDRGPNSSLSVQVRPTAVFGSGIDIHLTDRFDLRAQYHGLLYSNPDFETGDYLSKQITLTSEPTLSLVYNFTHPK
jgi:hypothetical protein